MIQTVKPVQTDMFYKLIKQHAVSRNVNWVRYIQSDDSMQEKYMCLMFSEKCNDAECKTCAVEATSSEKKCKVCNAKFITTDSTNGGECKGRF